MRHSFRHDAGASELDPVPSARPVGRSSLTQRHAVRLTDQERADDHARRDAAWLHAGGGGATVQRKEAPTAGPSEDDRFGAGPVATDARGRILAVNVIGGDRTQITIGLGVQQGVRVGMMGYVVADDGMLCEFQIHDAGDRTARAFVDTTVDGLRGHLHVMVNPSSRPGVAAPRQDMRARVIMVAVEDGRTRITIGFGERHGARYGMRGYLTDGGGRPYRRFEIAGLDLDRATAYVDDTVDNVRAHTTVVLNPS